MATRSQRGYVDTETGVIYDLVAVPRERHSGGGFFMVMQEALGRIADDDWPAGDYQVLVKLMSRLDWENFLHIEVAALAAEMGRSRERTSKAVARLVRRGVLHRGPRVGRSYTYRLDPNLGWKGSAPAKRRVQAELDRRGWSVLDGESQGPHEDALPGM